MAISQKVDLIEKTNAIFWNRHIKLVLNLLENLRHCLVVVLCNGQCNTYYLTFIKSERTLFVFTLRSSSDGCDGLSGNISILILLYTS